MTRMAVGSERAAIWRCSTGMVVALAWPKGALAAGLAASYAVWRIDVGALGWALAAAVAYGVLWRGLRPRPPRHLALWFGAGLAATVVALSSPLDSMGETVLLTMHMLEHMALTLVASILVVAGIPQGMLERVRQLPGIGFVLDRFWNLSGMLAYNVVLLAWHVPALYEAALHNEAIHDVEHLSFLLFGMVFWGPILRPLERDRGRPGATLRRVAGVLVSLGINTALGSYIFFVQNVLYPTYLAAPRVWGLIDVHTDQSIAGGALWSMGDMAYIAAGLALAVQWLQSQGDATSSHLPIADG